MKLAYGEIVLGRRGQGPHARKEVTKMKRYFALALVLALSVVVVAVVATSHADSSTPVPAAPTQATTAQENATAPDTDNVQQGDQTTPDQASATEATGETASESATDPANEPGVTENNGTGHADPDGQNVDHQFEGAE
jgi:hypothetical protein